MSLLWRTDGHHRDVQTVAAAAWPPEHISAEPGECPMTRHGVIRLTAVGPRLSPEAPRVFKASSKQVLALPAVLSSYPEPFAIPKRCP